MAEVSAFRNNGDAKVKNQANHVHVNLTTNPPKRIESRKIKDPVDPFIEDGDSLESLHRQIQDGIIGGSGNVRSMIWLITGVAGSGKTELARKYVHKYKETYDHCLWIKASTIEKAFKSFMQIELQIDKYSRPNKDTTVECVYQVVLKKRCLIVFDDADADSCSQNFVDSPLYRQCFPQTVQTGHPNSAVIVTSRNRELLGPLNKSQIVQLSGFSLERSISLLKHWVEFEDPESDHNSSMEINNVCGGLPVAIKQVAAIIFEENRQKIANGDEEYFTMKTFLTQFNDHSGKNYVNFKPKIPCVQYSQNVFDIFSMACNKIREKKYGPLAIDCLNVMSVLHSQKAQTELIHFLLHPETEVSWALILLHRYNLITLDPTSYTIHPVLQQVKFTTNVVQNEDNPTVETSLASALAWKVSERLRIETSLLPSLLIQRMSSEFPDKAFENDSILKSLIGKLNLYKDLPHFHIIILVGNDPPRKPNGIMKIFQKRPKSKLAPCISFSEGSLSNYSEIPHDVLEFLQGKTRFFVNVNDKNYSCSDNCLRDWIKEGWKTIGNDPAFSENAEDGRKSYFISVVEISEEDRKTLAENENSNLGLCLALALFVRQIVFIIGDKTSNDPWLPLLKGVEMIRRVFIGLKL